MHVLKFTPCVPGLRFNLMWLLSFRWQPVFGYDYGNGRKRVETTEKAVRGLEASWVHQGVPDGPRTRPFPVIQPQSMLRTNAIFSFFIKPSWLEMFMSGLRNPKLQNLTIIIICEHIEAFSKFNAITFPCYALIFAVAVTTQAFPRP